MTINVISYNIEGLTLEMNYVRDQSLKKYIIEKSNYLNEYLDNLKSDIICIQEYSPILKLNPKKYNKIIVDSNAIFYKSEKFSYIDHKNNKLYGLLVVLSVDKFIINVCTQRLPPYNENNVLREKIINKIDVISKDKYFIFAADTNMRQLEEKILINLIDCYYNATIIIGHYTLDKKFNPYFEGDNKKINKSRYDKIFYTNFFNCEQLAVIRPNSCQKLIHPIYPYGNVSDHYPVLAILTIKNISF